MLSARERQYGLQDLSRQAGGEWAAETEADGAFMRVMARVRPFVSNDIAQVANLFRKVFRPQYSADEVASILSEVFLGHPWGDRNLSSFVCANGRDQILGFLGVTPRPMRFKDRPILAAVSSHLMIDPDQASSLAGIQLQRAFFAGPQDLSLTDGANDEGLTVWTGFGGTLAPIYSMSWFRVLRPTAYAVSLLGPKSRALAPLSAVARLCSPLADSALVRTWPVRFRIPTPQAVATDLDLETLLSSISDFSTSESLRPEYDARSLRWLLSRADRIRGSGALRSVVFRNSAHEIRGWYLYYGNPTGVSEVMQLVARKGDMDDVFDHLCYDAWSRGSLGIAGRLDPKLVETVGRRKCLLVGGNPWVLAYSRDPELLRACCQGDAFLTRLDGEWCTSIRP